VRWPQRGNPGTRSQSASFVSKAQGGDPALSISSIRCLLSTVAPGHRKQRHWVNPAGRNDPESRSLEPTLP
jgi:hypothetical protein